jgi:hypothetical protein
VLLAFIAVPSLLYTAKPHEYIRGDTETTIAYAMEDQETRVSTQVMYSPPLTRHNAESELVL